MSGAYYQYGDLRRLALEMAIDSEQHLHSTDTVISRAESYFLFLTAGGPDGQI